MSSTITPEQQSERNQAVLKALREVFGPLVTRLSPPVEPATIYAPALSPAAGTTQDEDRQ